MKKYVNYLSSILRIFEIYKKQLKGYEDINKILANPPKLMKVEITQNQFEILEYLMFNDIGLKYLKELIGRKSTKEYRYLLKDIFKIKKENNEILEKQKIMTKAFQEEIDKTVKNCEKVSKTYDRKNYKARM